MNRTIYLTWPKIYIYFSEGEIHRYIKGNKKWYHCWQYANKEVTGWAPIR